MRNGRIRVVAAGLVPVLFSLVAMGLTELAARAAIIFVDSEIPPPVCTNYSAASRSCGEGDQVAYKTIAGAAAASAPGSIVVIRAGVYREPINPPVSGTPDYPILFQAYQNETVMLTDPSPTASLDPAIQLFGVSNIVVAGLTVSNVLGWLRADGASWNIIAQCTFVHAHGEGSRNGLKFAASDYNRILNNFLDDGWINLSLIDSGHNLVESNSFRRGRFALWNIRCGNFNVIRGNSFSNGLQQIGQITDCAGWPSSTPFKQDATAHNLVEENSFEFTPCDGQTLAYAGIQCSGQQTIVRRNRFYRTAGPTLELTFQPWIQIGTNITTEDARFVTGSRVYNNVLYGSRFAGVELPANGTNTFTDHLFKNNVLAGSVFAAEENSSPFASNLVGKPVQLLTERLNGFAFERNNILGTAPNQSDVIAHVPELAASQTLAWWERGYPQLFTNNMETPSQFVDADHFDFRLTPSSPLIDRGTYLTKTVTSGNGATLFLEDVTYFYDGFGIPGQLGDEIQLENQAQTARILMVNYSNHSLTLDQSLTWTAGQGVSLRYTGSAPDVGAFELAPSPQLHIRYSDRMIVVSWSSVWTGYALESTPALEATDWQPDAAPRPSGDLWTVSRPSGETSRFFRLVRTQ